MFHLADELGKEHIKVLTDAYKLLRINSDYLCVVYDATPTAAEVDRYVQALLAVHESQLPVAMPVSNFIFDVLVSNGLVHRIAISGYRNRPNPVPPKGVQVLLGKLGSNQMLTVRGHDFVTRKWMARVLSMLPARWNKRIVSNWIWGGPIIGALMSPVLVDAFKWAYPIFGVGLGMICVAAVVAFAMRPRTDEGTQDAGLTGVVLRRDGKAGAKLLQRLEAPLNSSPEIG